MSDSYKKHKIGDVTFNLYDIVAHYVSGDSLVVDTVSRSYTFNSPKDITNPTTEATTLQSALDGLGEGGGSTLPPSDEE